MDFELVELESVELTGIDSIQWIEYLQNLFTPKRKYLSYLYPEMVGLKNNSFFLLFHKEEVEGKFIDLAIGMHYKVSVVKQTQALLIDHKFRISLKKCKGSGI